MGSAVHRDIDFLLSNKIYATIQKERLRSTKDFIEIKVIFWKKPLSSDDITSSRLKLRIYCFKITKA